MDAYQVEQLIEMVRAYPAVYDSHDTHYTDFPYKEEIWYKIGGQLNEDPDACKVRWKTLRDSLQRVVKAEATGQTKGTKWKYNKEMAFLRPFVRGVAEKNCSKDKYEYANTADTESSSLSEWTTADDVVKADPPRLRYDTMRVVERLIEQVQRYPALYDPQHRDYISVTSKEEIWAEIGAEVEEDPEACKIRWKTLRDSLQRIVRAKHRGERRSTTWKYARQMAFLEPFVKGAVDFKIGDIEYIEYAEYERKPAILTDDPLDTTLTTSGTTTGSRTSKTSRRKREKPIAATSSTSFASSDIDVVKRAKQHEETVTIYVDNDNDNDDDDDDRVVETGVVQDQGQGQGQDAILDFFAHMAKTVRTFPPLQQAKVKQRVFEIVNSFELQLLVNIGAPTTTTTTTTTPSAATSTSTSQAPSTRGSRTTRSSKSCKVNAASSATTSPHLTED